MASLGEDESDEDETFVTLGTPLEVPDEDEPVKKPMQLEDMQAKDGRGRPRFHGAFTGGFSAGYFNTVGSKEGFVPKTFVSSREKRAEASDGGGQQPEDFMDEEDVGEHGIAPRKFVTGGQFSSEERRKRRIDEAKLATADSILGGDNSLLSVIVPERITIGVKLLRKMGWKEGQGIGPRVSRKQKKMQGKKLYGCAGPPESDEDLDDESVVSDVTFAPLDAAHVRLGAKENPHGLGYSGLDPRKALPSTHVNLFEPPPVRKGKSRKGIRGQAFGVGALEDEDEDVYTTDDMSNYDMTMGEEGDDQFGWTAPKHRGKEQQTPVGYVGKLLEGFTLSSNKLVQKKEFPPPSLPRDYRPVHSFSKPESAVPSSAGQAGVGVDYRKFLRPYDDAGPSVGPTSTAGPHSGGTMSTSGANSRGQGSRHGDKKNRHDALSRSVALEEQPFVGSVFDLIPESDRARMSQAKQGLGASASREPDTISSGESMFKKPFPPPMSALLPQKSFVSAGRETLSPAVEGADTPQTTKSSSSVEDQLQSGAPLFQGAVGFQPFSRDPAKQSRYDRYLEWIRHGHKDPYSAVGIRGHTEWEAEREREEFSKAAKLYRPLATMMATRFTSGGTYEQGEQVEVKAEETMDTSDAAKAAKMKMFGKLTREVHEWHPDNLVCKRFNVPNPYPGSSIVGLTTVKRDKYSVFTFLNFANPTAMAYEAKKTEHSTIETTNDSEKAIEKTEDVTQNVEKELNKGKAMKSIFSHLMETESETQRKTKPVSFTMKPKPSNKPKEFKSIFSHLENEEKSVTSKTATPEATTLEESKVDITSVTVDKDVAQSGNIAELKEKSMGEDGPGMDLFRAIFRNTDSEASSSSEDDGEGQGVSGSAGGQQSRGDNPSQIAGVSDRVSNTVRDVVAMETAPSSPPGTQVSTDVPHPPDSSGEELDPYGPSLPPGSINAPVSGTLVSSLPGYMLRSPGSSDEESDTYGPALPPSGPGEAIGSGSFDCIDLTTSASDVYVDLTRDSSPKHRHKDRHKHKKNKKEKHKKSKHKKKEKKKDKKKRSRHDSSDSNDASESSEGEEDNVDTDRQILQRLTSLQSAQRMTAANFL